MFDIFETLSVYVIRFIVSQFFRIYIFSASLNKVFPSGHLNLIAHTVNYAETCVRFCHATSSSFLSLFGTIRRNLSARTQPTVYHLADVSRLVFVISEVMLVARCFVSG